MTRKLSVPRLVAVLLVLLLAAPFFALAQTGGYPNYPIPRLTPGQVFPNVTEQDVCTPGYAQSVRNVSARVKAQVYQRYGIRNPRPGQYEIDHFIPIELGGNNAIANLWPQPYRGTWNAHQKDALEDRLHSLVCDGTLTLADAQLAIQTDWIAAYRTYVLGQ